jgi:hypothetical protein
MKGQRRCLLDLYLLSSESMREVSQYREEIEQQKYRPTINVAQVRARSHSLRARMTLKVYPAVGHSLLQQYIAELLRRALDFIASWINHTPPCRLKTPARPFKFANNLSCEDAA